MDRAWRWCIAVTLRDLRSSVQRGRPITRPNLERLFCRRWSAFSGRATMDAIEQRERETAGRNHMREMVRTIASETDYSD